MTLRRDASRQALLEWDGHSVVPPADGRAGLKHVQVALPTNGDAGDRAKADDAQRVPMGSSLAAVAQQPILRTRHHLNHFKEHTAAALGVTLKTLYNKLQADEAASAAAAHDK